MTVIFVSFLAAYVLPLIGNVMIKRGSSGALRARSVPTCPRGRLIFAWRDFPSCLRGSP